MGFKVKYGSCFSVVLLLIAAQTVAHILLMGFVQNTDKTQEAVPTVNPAGDGAAVM